MGKWETELVRTAERSAENKKEIDEKMKAAEKAMESAADFVKVYGKAAPKLSKASSEILEAEADCAEHAGELMVLEEQFEKAKKDKDKDGMKTIAAKMKPLITKFEKGRKEMKSAADDAVKAYQEIGKAAVDLRGVVGTG
jgi:outer membrane murein-binding lipoprotein Lpp